MAALAPQSFRHHARQRVATLLAIISSCRAAFDNACTAGTKKIPASPPAFSWSGAARRRIATHDSTPSA